MSETVSTAATSNGAESVDRLLLEREVERFLYREARLLDERRYDDWLALMSFDILYRAPVRIAREGKDDVVGIDELHHFDDDYGQLELRVQGLQVRSAWAEIPPSRTRRLVTNVSVEPLEDEDLRARRSSIASSASAPTSCGGWVPTTSGSSSG
jgi:3-phenylpropionate/cinnamic acid dioxygenase small subunit